MEMSSEDEEDGQISKREQEEERESRLINREKAPQEELISTMPQLQSLCLPRNKLAKYARMPWFEEYAKGMVHQGNNITLVLTLRQALGYGT